MTTMKLQIQSTKYQINNKLKIIISKGFDIGI